MQKNTTNLYLSTIYSKYIMRISALMAGILLTTAAVLAHHPRSAQTDRLHQRITVQYKNIPIKEALEQLQGKYALPLAYTNDATYLTKKISYSAQKKAGDVLRDLLRFADMDYQIKNDFILLTKRVPDVTGRKAQPTPVTGVVKDENDQPLSGVSITVKGSTRGVITDVDGSFTISVDPEDELEISYIGYEPQQVPVGTQNVFSIQLIPKANEFDEVTVVAFGTQKKESVVSS